MSPPFSFLLFAIASSLGFFLCAHTSEVGFGYRGTKGPNYWGNLNPQFAACGHGKHQSPVNIMKNQTVKNDKLKPLTRLYHPTNATLINNGFNIGVYCVQDVGVCLVNGLFLSLIKKPNRRISSRTFLPGYFQVLHEPNHVWGKPTPEQPIRFAAELHLVHKAEDGSFAVVSMLYAYGDPDPFVSKLMNSLGKLAKEVHGSNEEPPVVIGTINPEEIKKHTRKYYRYTGSLTTPPCTENVIWNILGKVRSISQEQVEALKAPLSPICKNNSRPCQKLNDRKIELYDEL